MLLRVNGASAHGAGAHLVGEEQVTHGLVLWVLHHCSDQLQHGSDSWEDNMWNNILTAPLVEAEFKISGIRSFSQ